MLTDIEKNLVRLLIQRNPTPDYMVQLGASDDFARSEIQAQLPALAIQWQQDIRRLNFLNTQNQTNVTQLQADLDSWNAYSGAMQ